MNLQDILSEKGTTVYTISPDANLLQVARKLVECKVGSLLIYRMVEGQSEPRLAGIVSERDILRMVATGSRSLEEITVGEVMSTHLIVGSPGDSVEDIMGLLTRERKRHLPVLCEGRVVGIVSIGDIVKAQHRALATENRFMKDYITEAR